MKWKKKVVKNDKLDSLIMVGKKIEKINLVVGKNSKEMIIKEREKI